MIHPIIKHKAGLLNLTEELGNVSKACNVMGLSRDTFYRYQGLVKTGGIDSLINKSPCSPNLKNRIDVATERAVVAMQSINPHTVNIELVVNCVNKVCLFLVVVFALSGCITI